MLILQAGLEYFSPPRVVVPKPKKFERADTNGAAYRPPAAQPAPAYRPPATATPAPAQPVYRPPAKPAPAYHSQAPVQAAPSYGAAAPAQAPGPAVRSVPISEMLPARRELFEGRVKQIEDELSRQASEVAAYQIILPLTVLTNHYFMGMPADAQGAPSLLSRKKDLVSFYSDPACRGDAKTAQGPIPRLEAKLHIAHRKLQVPGDLLDEMNLMLSEVPNYMHHASQAFGLLCSGQPAAPRRAAELMCGWAYSSGGSYDVEAVRASPTTADVEALLASGRGAVRAPPALMARLIKILSLFVQEPAIVPKMQKDGRQVTPKLRALAFPAKLPAPAAKPAAPDGLRPNPLVIQDTVRIRPPLAQNAPAIQDTFQLRVPPPTIRDSIPAQAAQPDTARPKAVFQPPSPSPRQEEDEPPPWPALPAPPKRR